MAKMTKTMERALLKGTRHGFQTGRQAGGAARGASIAGQTMEALGRAGLAEVQTGQPFRYRLTEEGALTAESIRRGLAAAEELEARWLAEERAIGAEDGYIGEAFLKGRCTKAQMERAFEVRREMRGELAVTA
jgi:hypothetical protein